jgi:tripartite-type tricarboxylate transporter receptor subunit TctC
VPFPAGSPALDGTARIVAEKLRPALGVPVIVDNRPGAGTVVGNAAVASAAPDGHTLLYGVGTAFTMLPHQLATRPYDEFQDFTPITLVATSPLFMAAHASVPASNVRELVAFAKANPGKLSFASWQFGGINHVVLEQLKVEQALDMVHVPYKGPEDALKDLIEGRVQVMMGASVTLLGLVKAGKLRALGAASNSRMRSIPEVRTFAEQGFAGYDYVGTLIVMGHPPDIVRRLNSELVRVLREPETTAFFTKAAPTFDVSPSTPEELDTLLRAQHRAMEPLIRRLGIRID